jgi:hypothetical protein
LNTTIQRFSELPHLSTPTSRRFVNLHSRPGQGESMLGPHNKHSFMLCAAKCKPGRCWNSRPSLSALFHAWGIVIPVFRNTCQHVGHISNLVNSCIMYCFVERLSSEIIPRAATKGFCELISWDRVLSNYSLYPAGTSSFICPPRPAKLPIKLSFLRR